MSLLKSFCVSTAENVSGSEQQNSALQSSSEKNDRGELQIYSKPCHGGVDIIRGSCAQMPSIQWFLHNRDVVLRLINY